MAGGPTTPELVAAVGDAGGLGLLAAGYLTAAAFAAQLDELAALSGAPFGVNLFLPSPRRGDPAALAAYAERLRPLAARFGTEPGAPRWDDDDLEAKLDVICARRPAVVTFTFAAPETAMVTRVREATGAVVGATVTSAGEARAAWDAGADLLVAQGVEAGGHRGTFDDDDTPGLPLLELLALVRQEVPDAPLVATGGLVDTHDIRHAMAAGADAVQLGTAFLLTPEAGTNPAHRAALRDPHLDRTRLTRAFTGRTARGLDNAMARDPYGAPAAYPEVHHLTRPLRAAAAAVGDLETPHFWAGTRHAAITDESAGALVARLLPAVGGPQA